MKSQMNESRAPIECHFSLTSHPGNVFLKLGLSIGDPDSGQATSSFFTLCQVPSHEIQNPCCEATKTCIEPATLRISPAKMGLSTAHWVLRKTHLRPMSRLSKRSRLPLPLATVLLLGSLCFTGPQASRPSFRTGLRAADEAWREAYDMELQRNRLLREQLKEDMELPEVCEVDWKASYEMLVDDGEHGRQGKCT